MAGLTSELLAEASFELLPMKSALDKAAALPPGCNVSVTASPAKGMDATLDLTVQLRELGYRAAPHLSARMIKDRIQLSGLMKRMEKAAIDHVFASGRLAVIASE